MFFKKHNLIHCKRQHVKTVKTSNRNQGTRLQPGQLRGPVCPMETAWFIVSKEQVRLQEGKEAKKGDNKCFS